MKDDDRVITDDGPGTIVRFVHDTAWSFRRPQRLTFVLVHVDGKEFPKMYTPDQITEEAMTTIEPDPQPTPDPTPPTTEPPTEPDADEEPEPETEPSE